MNIQEAKDQIRKACTAYLTKDAFGEYVMPVEAQRPVFMVGAPGIGKTAIVGQVADELGLALVDYSMTHHTRQSAIGLPVIEERVFDGQNVAISEYTMSEIIASIYDTMERTGRTEGILFLDEINCVSETLTPMMLRFLQSKTFGNHKVPDGWVIVTAGNPPEYNRSARLFDVVTLDRLKVMEVDPDLEAWKAWSRANGAHEAILTFLDLRPESFYCMETQGRHRDFVTARAWSDLSTMMRLYEMNDLEVDDALVAQYIQIPSVAQDFCNYLALYRSYAAEYRIQDILDGTASEGLLERVSHANFDERAALGGLLVDAVRSRAAEPMMLQGVLEDVRDVLVKAAEDGTCNKLSQGLQEAIEEAEADLVAREAYFRQVHSARYAANAYLEMLHELLNQVSAASSFDEAYGVAVEAFNERVSEADEAGALAAAAVDHAIAFIEEAFGSGNELVLFLSAMVTDDGLSRLVETYDIESYQRRSDLLKMDVRAKRLRERLMRL